MLIGHSHRYNSVYTAAKKGAFVEDFAIFNLHGLRPFCTEHTLDNDNGIHTGTEQQLLITQTLLFVAHLVPLIHASKIKQETCGAQIVVLIVV